jgi:hypothetical protein
MGTDSLLVVWSSDRTVSLSPVRSIPFSRGGAAPRQSAVKRNKSVRIRHSVTFPPAPVTVIYYPHESRRYLKVPFAEKDQCKKMGGHWDPAVKRWWVPRHTPLQSIPHRWWLEPEVVFPEWKPPRVPGRAPSAREVELERERREERAAYLRRTEVDEAALSHLRSIVNETEKS